MAYMNSRQLKFAMMNEAYLVRRWRSCQPRGEAPGQVWREALGA